MFSMGITKGESDWCQAVAPVTSHTGTGAPVSDPHIVNSEPVKRHIICTWYMQAYSRLPCVSDTAVPSVYVQCVHQQL